VGVPVSNVGQYVEEQQELLMLEPGSFVVDFAQGFVYIRCQLEQIGDAQIWLHALRQPALAMGGYAMVMSLPEQMQGKLDRWGYRPEGLAIMHRLKARWDPQGILNPQYFLSQHME